MQSCALEVSTLIIFEVHVDLVYNLIYSKLLIRIKVASVFFIQFNSTKP